MKHCNKCDTTKPVAEFHKDSSKRDGLRTQCKACKNMVDAKWRAANPERHRENARAWSTANPERKLETNRAWCAANPERKLETERAWRAANPERMSVIGRNRNAKRKTRKLAQSVGVVTPAELTAILAQPCLACGTREAITVEHLVPLARGGAHSIGNLAPLCQSCNSSKGSMLWIEWKHSNRPRALEVFTAA
jgi:5-methylcytosine-specific restriction endonuclease McrA